MSNKRQRQEFDWRTELSKCGWNVRKRDAVAFNSGSETAKHIHAKTATARLLKKHDYRVDTEVEHAERGEIDLVAYPTRDDQRPFAVELETSPTEEVVKDKLDRYYDGTPFVECYIINVSELSLNISEMEEQIGEELGLEA